MSTQPLLPPPAGPELPVEPPAPPHDRVSPRTLVALGAYLTPVVATATWFAAFAVARAAPGGASDDFTWLPLYFWIAAAPVWVLASLVGTLAVVLPPPRTAGHVGLVLLLPLLLSAYVETWVWMPHWGIEDDGFRVSTASTVVTVLGALLTLLAPVVMIVGLAQAHVVGRWWWVAAVAATALLAVGQWSLDTMRYTGDMPDDSAATSLYPDDPTYADPSAVPCTDTQVSAVEKVLAAIPWAAVEQPDLSPDGAVQVYGTCMGGVVLVDAGYDDVVKQLPAELARAGVPVQQVYSDEFDTELVGTTADGVQVGVSVTQAEDAGAGTLVAVMAGDGAAPEAVPTG